MSLKSTTYPVYNHVWIEYVLFLVVNWWLIGFRGGRGIGRGITGGIDFMKLTKTAVEALAIDEEKNYYVWDDELPSFGVIVYKTGNKSFVLYRRIGTGRLARKKLFIVGSCHLMTPVEARAKARELAMETRDGNDPSRPKAADMTVADIMGYYIEKHSKGKPSEREVIKISRLYIVPNLGRVRVHELDTPDVRDFKDKAGKRSKAQTNKALGYLSAAINFARGDFRELRSLTNPCEFVKKFKLKPRRVFVEFEKMPDLINAIKEDENQYARAALMLYILLGQRKDEILRVKRSDIDFKAKRLYWEDTKNGTEHFLPLSDAAFEIIKRIPVIKGSPWLFPALNHARGMIGETHLKDIKRPWKRIKEVADQNDITIHDLRRTFGSWMAMSGEGLEMIGKILNHSGPKVTFDHYGHFQDGPIRDALNRHASKVLSIDSRRPSAIN
jgi:hypothetical protein